MRGNRAWRGLATGTAGIVFVLALLVLSPYATAARPTLTFLPPYTGGTVAPSNGTVTSVCGSQAHIVLPPGFNLSTGKARFVLSASAGKGPACSPSQGHAASGSAFASVTLTSASFVGVANGVYVFRPSFHLAWLVNVSTTTGPHQPSSSASAFIELRVAISDLTSGSSWSPSTPYFNGTALSNANTTTIRMFHTNLSLPVLLPLTKGDTYVFSVTLNGEVDAIVGMGGANTAIAKLVVGPLGTGITLTKVTVS